MTYDNIKNHKKQGLTLSLKNTILKKPWREGGSDWLPRLFRISTEIDEVEKKIPDVSGLVTTFILNTNTEQVKTVKLQAFDSSYFYGKIHFEDDDMQSYLMF